MVVRLVLGGAIESLSQQSLGNIVLQFVKQSVMEYPRVETESSPFEHTNGLLTHAVESADFAEIVRKLSKSTWFCEVAEA